MSGVRTYQITITGISPLLMHWDNIEWADEMERWKVENGKLPAVERVESRAGDDRTPAHRWLGSVYNDGKVVVIPAENIQRMCMEAGAMMLVPGGRMGKTFKAQSQSGMMPGEPFWPLEISGRQIKYADLLALKDEKHFGVHVAKARELGIQLWARRARIGMSKHVRVRPRINTPWKATGTIRVIDPSITTDVLAQLFETGGKYKGLGDWRPGSKTPGSFGMFDAKGRPL